MKTPPNDRDILSSVPTARWTYHLAKGGAAALLGLFLYSITGALQESILGGAVLGFMLSKGWQLWHGAKPWADWFTDAWNFGLPLVFLSSAWPVALLLWLAVYVLLLPWMEP